MPNDEWEHNHQIAGHSRVDQLSSTVRYMRPDPSNTVGRGAYNGPIPRIRSNVQTMKNIRQPIKRQFDTFGENALETIHDEFSFLDEPQPEAPSPSSSGQAILPPSDSRRKRLAISINNVVLCLISFIQVVCSTTFIILAVLRCYSEYNIQQISPSSDNVVEDETQLPQTQNLLKILSFRAGLSVILPSLLQLFSAFPVCWIFVRSAKLRWQLIHIIFSLLSIISWYDGIEVIALELNLRLAHSDSSERKSFIIFMALLGVTYLGTIVLSTLTVILICQSMLNHTKNQKNVVINGLTIATSLLSAAIVFFSSLATSKSLSGPTTTEDLLKTPFYGFGLRELIISVHIFICSLFFFLSSLLSMSGLNLAVILLNIQLIVVLVTSIFNSQRLSTVLWSLKPIVDSQLLPFNQMNAIVLHSLFIALLLVLLVQLVVNVRSFTINNRQPQPIAQQQSTLF